MISQRAKYALRALVALVEVRAGEPLMISEISRRKAIPKKFLEQILLELKRAAAAGSAAMCWPARRKRSPLARCCG